MMLKKAEDIEAVLETIQTEKIPLKVRLHGSNEVFVSSLVSQNASPDAPSMYISRLLPEYGNKIIRMSRMITVEFSLPEAEGSPEEQPTYTFNAIFLRPETVEGVATLRVSYPEKRKYPRVDPGPDNPIPATVIHEKITLHEDIANISAGGFGIYTGCTDILLPSWAVAKAEFSLPGGMQVRCPVVLRWFLDLDGEREIHGKRYRCYYGFEFEIISKDMQDAIIQYIIDREYDELYRE